MLSPQQVLSSGSSASTPYIPQPTPSGTAADHGTAGSNDSHSQANALANPSQELQAPVSTDGSSSRSASSSSSNSDSSSSSSDSSSNSGTARSSSSTMPSLSNSSSDMALNPLLAVAVPSAASPGQLNAFNPTAVLQDAEQISRNDRLDIYKAVGVGAAVSILAGILDHDWVEAHQELSMAAVFCLGYVGIVVEEVLGFNKAAVALLMAVSLWIIRSTGGDTQVWHTGEQQGLTYSGHVSIGCCCSAGSTQALQVMQ